MTCIVALKTEDRLWMGCDSLGSNWCRETVRKDPKVFRNKDFLIGYCGSYRMGQLLMPANYTPPVNKKKNAFDYMISDFVESIRKLFKDKGYSDISNNRETGGQFIVCYKDEIYVVHDDYQIGIPDMGFMSIGSGESYALGHLNAIVGTGISPHKMVTGALETAEVFAPGVRSPFLIRSMKIR